MEICWLKKKKIKHLVFVLCHVVLFLIVGTKELYPQKPIDTNILNVLLTNDGFENVRSATNDTSVYLAFENRRYRDNGRAIAEVLQIFNENFKPEQPVEIKLMLLFQDVPMLLVLVNSDDFMNLEKQVIDIEEFTNRLQITSDYISAYKQLKNPDINNRTRFKPDFVVIPQIRTQFGNFDNPVQSNINLIPELNIQFTKGLSFQGQMIIPLQNDFYFDEEGKEIRPGNITLNQFISLEDDIYINATAGFFNKNRAGLNLEIRKYIANGKFSIGSNIGYTTGYSYTGNWTEYLEYENYLTALLELEYRYLPFDLTGTLQAGNFLYNGLGLRFDVVRQFGEVNIGFFALAASGEINGGFNLAIPLPPSKYCKLKYTRIRPSEKFKWEYQAKGFPRAGVVYNTENRLHELFLNFNPDQIKKQIIRELRKKF
jgi:hypothetical protein